MQAYTKIFQQPLCLRADLEVLFRLQCSFSTFIHSIILCMPLVRLCLTRPSLHPFLNALSYFLLTNPLSFHLKMHGYFYTQVIHWGCSLQPLLPSPLISSLSPAVLTVNIVQPVPSCSLLRFLYSKQTESCLSFSASSSANNPIWMIQRQKKLIRPH